MKQSMQYLKIISLLLLIVAAGACEGPEGPMGPGGPSGRDGLDGEDGQDGTSIVAKFRKELYPVPSDNHLSPWPELDSYFGGNYHFALNMLVSSVYAPNGTDRTIWVQLPTVMTNSNNDLVAVSGGLEYDAEGNLTGLRILNAEGMYVYASATFWADNTGN